MKLIQKQDYNSESSIYDIILENELLGSLELVFQDNINTIYIENIKKDSECTKKGITKLVVNYLREKYKCNLACLPLPHLRNYYESIGFKPAFKNPEGDIFYKLDINTKLT